MSFSTTRWVGEYRCMWFFDIACHYFLFDAGFCPWIVFAQNLGDTKIFLLTTTKMSEFMTMQPSHFVCIKSTILKGLRQMYIDSPCPSLGVGIKISHVSVDPAVIDPNEGCCITRCTFLLTHISKAGDKLKKPTKEPFHVFSFDDTEEKVTVRFEGKKSQDAIYEITFCHYLHPENALLIDPSIRFLYVAYPASAFEKVVKGP